MKFALAQLRNLKMPYSFDEEMDLSKDLDGFEDIIRADMVKVHTTIKERGADTYLCEFKICANLTIEDSVTLEEIPYTIDVEAEEIFSTDPSLIDAFIFEGLTMNTYEAVLTNILASKPMSLTLAEDIIDESDNEEEAKENINPAFAALKDLL